MQRIHCSYHKCLTVFFSRVMHAIHPFGGYGHFESRLEEFYKQHSNFHIASINNHALDLSVLDASCRISRFIRDPRDLVVSGYFYHKRGAEAWCNIPGPKEENLRAVRGCAPEAMKKGESFAECLQRLDTPQGLIAEIDFRFHHFSSMANWSLNDPRIKIFRYEEILGNERKTMIQIADHYGLNPIQKCLAGILAYKYSAKKQSQKTQHIRNPQSRQWVKHFTPEVEAYFMERYAGLIAQYNY